MPRRKRPELPPPTFLIDRCVAKDVESWLQQAGYTAFHLFTLFNGDDQKMPDEDIFSYAEAQNMVILTRDRYDRRDRSVLAALKRHKCRSFCLANKLLNREQQVAVVRTNIGRIVRASRKPGPYLYGVYRDRIERLWPRPGGP